MNYSNINATLNGMTPQEIIRWDFETSKGKQFVTTSFGVYAAMMLHLATSVNPNITVIFIDTGYNFPETLAFGLELVVRLKLNLHVCKSPISPKEMEKEFGSLWVTDRERYAKIRKIDPLLTALTELSAQSVIDALRTTQTDERSRLQILEKGYGGSIRKIHPTLNWTEDMVLEYIKLNNLPLHPLFYEGYGSVGDMHSTYPGPGRDGRWPGDEKKECGLHLPELMEGGKGI